MKSAAAPWARDRRARSFQRRMAWTGIVTILALLISLFPQVAGLPVPTAEAHNLNASVVYVFFDPDTQAMLDARIAGGWVPGTPLLQDASSPLGPDELGIIIKIVPDEGTTTGVGGYTTFYVPDGLQVLDAAFLLPGSNPADGITDWDKVPAKGQARMPAVGAGGEPTVSLVGITRGPNILGVTSPIVTAANTNLGTLPGVYGDSGIFYSVEPETAFNSYYPTDPAPLMASLKNNSGDAVGFRTILKEPLNAWDAWQMAAFGIAGTTNPSYPGSPIVDSNGRGYAPWGLANVVAGPQSGYAWGFDKSIYDACDPPPVTTDPVVRKNCIDQATQAVGPWQRIKYDGSLFADDPPGNNPAVQPYVSGTDASWSGYALSPANPLPATTGQGNGTPNAVRWAFGQLTQNRPEYAWIKVRINDYAQVLDNTGCPKWTVDTFGGDAGGDSGGKDHIWRYYDPNSVTFDGCLAVGKPATRELVKVGEYFQYKVKLYNAGNNNFSTVQVKDTLPSGATFISAVPAPSTVSLPYLTWNVSPFKMGQMFEATVTVQAKSGGLITNSVCAVGTTDPGGQTISSCANDTTLVGNLPLLDQGKTVTPTAVAPGGQVTYTVRIRNIGTGATGSPVAITELLPAGFTYVGPLVNATMNGANVTATTTVNATNPNRPVFTVPGAIQGGSELLLSFKALIGANVTSGSYCNAYTSNQAGINLTTGSLACVQVGGGAIGDTLFRDWDGDGVRDPEDEGLPGVTVELRDGVCTPNVNCVTAVTDANGQYLFNGLVGGTYTVVVKNPPAGYGVTADPVGALDGQATITLATNEKRLDIDFGYRPGGAGTIGDRVFEDANNNGLFDGTDAGINGVTLTLYEDTNGDGVVTPGADAQIGTTTTAGGGLYQFTNLDPTRSYIVVATDGAGSAVDTYFTNPYVSSTGGSLQSVSPAMFTAQGNNVTTADFGYFGQTPGSIGDQVFIDANGNGVFDAGEQTLAHIGVSLYQDLNGNGVADAGEPLIRSTATSITGTYTFTDLAPGNYVVDVDQADPDLPPGYASTLDPIFASLTAGQNRTDVDFPFVQLISKQVSPSNALPGSTLTYTITTNYPGPDLLNEAVISDTIPAGTTYLAGSVSGNGVYSSTLNAVNWDLGTNSPALPGLTAQEGYALCPVVLNAPALADTYISKKDPTRNNGGNTLMITRPADTTEYKYSLLKFDVSSIPAGAIVRSATLGVNVQATRSSNHVDKVHRMLTAWVEGTGTDDVCTNAGSVGATWNASNCTNSWASGAFSSADYDATAVASIAPKTKGYKLADVTAMVDAWVNGGKTNNGLALISTGTDKGDAKYYNRENTTVNTDPYLKVVYYVQTLGGCSGPTVLDAVADTYVAYGNETNNYGVEAQVVTRPANATSLKHSLVRFDLVAIPADAVISSATLTMTVESARSTNHDDEVRMALTHWTEGDNSSGSGATWMDADGLGPGDWKGTSGRGANTFGPADYGTTVYATIQPTPDETGKPATVTAAVQDWVNVGKSNYGFVLLSTGTDGGDGKYHSRESTTAAKRPKLQVNWTLAPNPAGQTAVRLHATPFLLGQTGQIKVTMQVTASQSIASLTPPATLSVVTEGPTYTLASGPTPAGPVSLAPGTPVYFTYVYNVTPSTTPGTIQFSGKPSASGIQFATGFSEGVIVTPPLTFKVTVNNPATVNVVTNVASLEDGGALGLGVPSNVSQTALTGSIGDRVWADLDGDGLQDADEPGLSGVQVCATPTGGGAAVCATTDVNGHYRIYGLTTDGTYNVALTPATIPAGYISTYSPPQPRTATAAGDNGADFGLQPPGTGVIGDTVWLDANSDGSLNGAETGLPGITVQLYKDLDNDGVIDPGEPLIQTDVTDASGNYTFTGLNPGNYLVWVDPSSPVTSPYNGTTTLGAATTLVSGNQPEQVTLAAGQVYNDADFGYNWGGSIGDYVWYDNNRNQAADESPATPIEGATVLLYHDADNDGILDPEEYTPIAFMDTDASGQYLFENLPPGNYLVDVYEDSITTDGNRDVVPTTPDVRVVALGPNQAYLDADFGYYEGAWVRGNVFHDDDRNELFDPSENGLAGITVTLTGTDKNGNPVSETTTTDANGHFIIIVPEGDYTLTYNTTQTTAAGYPDATTVTSFDFHAYPGEDWHPIFDFGVDYSGKIGDRVWNDANGDGNQDAGEPGLAGVTVNLYASDGATWLAATVTDANGNYLFQGVPDGAYVVKVNPATLPAGFGQTYDNFGSQSDNTGQATVSGGGADLTADFGYRYVAGGGAALYTISGRVYSDANNNGNDDGEPGFANVDVTVACGAFGTFVVQTDSTGAWALAGIPENTVCTVLDADETDLPRTDYVATETPGTPITVTGNLSGLDFGYNQRPGSISGTVCLGDGDGQCVIGEPGISNVPVTLTWFGPDGILGTTDDQVFNTTTDANGDYSFGDLEPGLYQIVETNLTGYTSLADVDGGNPDIISPVLLPLGGTVTDRDFEDTRLGDVTVTKTLLAPLPGPATISDTVKFEIVVKNTGQSLLTTVPLWDYYSPACLENPVAVPPALGTGTNPALGVLHWPNLGPLAPGEQHIVIVDFHANITDAMYWKEGGWEDYAAKGMPDFDQKQDEWFDPVTGKWFFCGPVAAANSLWWFDSKFEPNPVPPPAVNDGYPLVQAYGAWDDHDAKNVQPFVNNLAALMGTTPANGTSVGNLANGISTYLTQKGLINNYTVTVLPKPPFEWVESEVRRSEDVVLLLGFWQEVGIGLYERVGGHYVTVAGVDSLNRLIGFSDPYRDAAEAGGLGRILPNPHPYLHPAQPPDEVHNDAKYLSHDVYPALPSFTPGGVWGPEGYATTCADIEDFADQNVGDLPNGGPCLTGAPIYTEVEYAVAVSPLIPTVTCDPTTNIAVVSGAEDEFGLMLPEAQAHAQVRIVEEPGIGVAKRVVTPVVNHGDGAYTVEYSVLVQNVGNTVLNSVQVTDSLAATFTGAVSWNVVAGSISATGGLTANTNFNGNTDKNLLIGTDSLASLAQGTITFKVKVTPGSKLGTYNNTAVGSGVSPLGAMVTDDSTDGVDTDPDTTGTTPADNPQPGDDNIPTPVSFTEAPAIGLAKAVDSVVNNGNGTYLVTFLLTVENFGDVVLNNLVITDDIVTQFAGLSPTGFAAANGTLTASGTWNGTAGSNILQAGQSLAVGATGTVKISFTVTPGFPRTVNNTAYTQGTSPAGANVTDQSTVGTDPDNDGGDPGNDNNNNPGDNSTPTPVTFAENPVIGVAKAVNGAVENLGGGQYRVTYLITVRNYGDVALSNIQVTDNLATTFTGATSWSVESVTSADFTVSGSYTGSTPNTGLLVGTDSLAVGASGTITLKVLVTPGANLGPYNNRAIAAGDSPAGTPVTDQSQNGTNPDPDGDNNPGNNSDLTPVSFTAITRIGVAKEVVLPVVNNGDGTYDVTYAIVVKNMGDTQLLGVQVTDNLNTTFGAGKHAVQSLTSATFTVNWPGYNGDTNLNLLAGTDTLNPGQSGTITLVVRVTPGTNLGPYNNTARGTGTSPGGVPAADNSQNGADPDPDGDGDPTNNNIPTPVSFTEAPAIGVAKRVMPPVVNNGDGAYTVEYSVLVQNVGNVVLHNVQVTDDLAATFAGATSWSVVAGSLSATGGLTVNSGFNGSTDKNLLTTTPANSLAKHAEGTITFKVKVTPGSNLGPYNNSATGSGVSPAGTTVTDVSQDGLDTDPDTGGTTPADNPNPGDDSDPTPVRFTEAPQIGLAKALKSSHNNGDGTFTVAYTLTVVNYGDVELRNLQVTDDLSATFSGASNFSVASVTSPAFSVNAGYTGSLPNINLLAGTDTLAVGAQGTIILTVVVTPGTNPGPYNNLATATAVSPAGTQVQDVSQNGLNPDPDGDGNPTNNTAETPVQFPERPVIGIAKTVSSVVNNGNGTHTVTYLLTVENLGDVNLSNVQVTDNLAVTFAPPATFVVNSLTSPAGHFTVNGSYNGGAVTQMLAAGNTLAVGAIKTLTVVVTVTPGTSAGPYNNSARADGVSPIGAFTYDISDNGVDPDPNGNGDPLDPDENDPTPVLFERPAIGAAKVVVGAPINNGDGTYDVTYSLVVENLGDVALTNVQLTDNLNTTFGPGKFVVQSKSATGLTVNGGYNGDTDVALLAASQTLNVGASATITLVVRVTPGSNLGPYNNQANASGTASGVTVTDPSDNGTNPDPDNDNNANEAGENDPTPVSFTENPVIGVAKRLVSSTNNGDGTFTVQYTIVVQNVGDVVLKNVQVTDDLALTFAGATSFSVVPGSLSATGLTANTGFNGTSNKNLLAGTDSLAALAEGAITFSVLVRPATSPATYNNLATGSGRSPADVLVTDVSTDGSDTDPDTGGTTPADNPNPGDDSVPTPVTVTQTPGIAIVKAGPAVSYAGATAVYTYTVTNTGNVRLGTVTVTDDVCGNATYVSGDTNGDTYLDLNETWLFTCSYVVQANDPDPLINIATARGVDPLGRPVSNTDDWTTDLVQFRIGDTVWVDVDNSGTPDPGEQGLYNVPVTITGTDIDNNPVNITAYTDINGKYLVPLAKPGSYTVTTPLTFNGFQLTSPGPSGYNITLTTAAPQNLDADFGYKPPTSVTVFNFGSAVADEGVTLWWEVFVPQGALAPSFDVYRAQQGETTWTKLTADEPVSPVTLGDDILDYTFTDISVQPGTTYLYKLVNPEDPEETYGPYTVVVSDKTKRVFLPLLLR